VRKQAGDRVSEKGRRQGSHHHTEPQHEHGKRKMRRPYDGADADSPLRQPTRDEDQRGRGRHPSRRDAERTQRSEADQHQPHDNHRYDGEGRRLGHGTVVRSGRQVTTEQQPMSDVLNGNDDQPDRRHPCGEAHEGQPQVVHRKKVGQVGHGQQQGRGVGQPPARGDQWP